ncbi:MAG: hypothetical protein AAF958_01360 [Planctomycetota bacterium]
MTEAVQPKPLPILETKFVKGAETFVFQFTSRNADRLLRSLASRANDAADPLTWLDVAFISADIREIAGIPDILPG